MENRLSDPVFAPEADVRKESGLPDPVRHLRRPPRVAAVHDLSAFGRCALAVVLPVLTAMGVQCLPVPTALLSTHTGGFTDIVKLACDDFPGRTARHWAASGILPDCVYSGYLGSPSQAGQVVSFRRLFPEALLVVDPVLGDEGKPYGGISGEMISSMSRLAASADLITPNPTEVSLLLGAPYSEDPLPAAAAKEQLRALSGLGPRPAAVLITGRKMERGRVCNLCFIPAASRLGQVAGLTGDQAWLFDCDYHYPSYPGTGDIFASVVTAALAAGRPLPQAVGLATAFVERCITLTAGSGEPVRDGVFLEYALPELRKMVPREGRRL